MRKNGVIPIVDAQAPKISMLCRYNNTIFTIALSLLLGCTAHGSDARDLKQVLESGELRHLGVPYASFVTGSGDGLDVELMQGFAAHLGVQYRFVETTWGSALGDLTGRHARRGESGVELLEETQIRGDVIANGMTILLWRQDLIAFSEPTFPSAVWLVARADSRLSPIKPSGSLADDIVAVKAALAGRSLLVLLDTCLDPALYSLDEAGVEIRLPKGKLNLNEMAPAILNHEAQTTLLDVPDALIALEKWPGQLKIIGPISDHQMMGAGFRKDAPALREAFNRYFDRIRKDGTYNRMVERYYPTVLLYYASFFNA